MAHRSARHHTDITRPLTTRRELVPIEGQPWLTRRSWLGPGGYACLGMGGLIAGLCMLIERLNTTRSPTGEGSLSFLLMATLVALVFTLCLVGMQALNRRMYQWCPDCLQYMTRGAHVCPFCGFRPTPGEPDIPSSRSSQRTDAAHS